MFTGIIQCVATVRDLVPKGDIEKGGDVEMTFAVEPGYLTGVQLGDSISSNGCCLTVTKLLTDAYAVDVSRESLDVTTLKFWKPGQRINLEKALRAGDPLGGHYVSGHVDGVGKVVERHDDARSVRMRFAVSSQLGRFIAKKGSVAIDGVSLTVNEVGDRGEETWFEVNLIPHTLAVTTLNEFRPDTPVNIEIDIIARYFERARQAEQHALQQTR